MSGAAPDLGTHAFAVRDRHVPREADPQCLGLTRAERAQERVEARTTRAEVDAVEPVAQRDAVPVL